MPEPKDLSDKELKLKLMACQVILALSTARELPEIRFRRDVYYAELISRVNPMIGLRGAR
jgi:hypothetical protein